MKVLDKVNESWWWVEVSDEFGYVPANHLSSEPPVAEDAWQNDEYFSSYEALVRSHLPRLFGYKYVFKFGYRNYTWKCLVTNHGHWLIATPYAMQ